MTRWHVGTMGYGYKDWLGIFYPNHARPRNYLQHYSTVFDAVEMDTTFYGVPKADRVRGWAQQVPQHFIFCPKTPREITHEGKWQDNVERMAEFIEAVQHFGNKLGAILIQFPPEATIERLDDLQIFLETLPRRLHFAVEFRHPTWDENDVRKLLQENGVSWVSPEYIHLPQQLHITADFAYIRFLGRHGQFERKNRIQRDVHPILTRWWNNLRSELDRLHTVYAFFNNDFSGYSPATVNRFKELAGLPTQDPDIPVQGRLF